MKAVILAGGLDKLLRPLTNERPKTMIEVCGIPIIGWQLNWLAKHDIRKVIISIGYLKQVVMEYVGTDGRFGVEVQYSEEDEPLGTGGVVNSTRDLVGSENERFLMLYGDGSIDFGYSRNGSNRRSSWSFSNNRQSDPPYTWDTEGYKVYGRLWNGYKGVQTCFNRIIRSLYPLYPRIHKSKLGNSHGRLVNVKQVIAKASLVVRMVRFMMMYS